MLGEERSLFSLNGKVSVRIHDPIAFKNFQDRFKELQTVLLTLVKGNYLMGRARDPKRSGDLVVDLNT